MTNDEVGNPFRDQYYIFEASNVKPRIMRVIRVYPRQLFRAERIIVDDGCLDVFIINNIMIDSKPQFPVNNIGVSCVFFAENAPNNIIVFDTCKPGGQIEMRVTNISKSNKNIFREGYR